jgi:6-phosphofructokinase 1
MPFEDILDDEGKRVAIRRVSVRTESYAVARSYMIRLEASDLEDELTLRQLARTCKRRPEEFRKRFEYLVKNKGQ